MTSERAPTLERRWTIFINERFPLTAHLPMTLLFAAANVGLAITARGTDNTVRSCIVGSLLALCFLFRLRCFDEIKDYTTDAHVNPERPLPRGVLTVRQVKGMIAALTMLELALAAVVGWTVLVTHLIAVGYSYLMYREFFIGDYLRPRLTAYAVTHTFSSVLLGYSLASCTTGMPVWRFSPLLLGFGLANWMLFNVFEFARKTFAREEEAPGVDSYSTLYRPWGAMALTFSQIMVALGVVWWLPSQMPVTRWPLFAAAAGAGAVLLAGIVYAARPRRAPAKVYRAVAAAFLLLFYAVLAWGFWS